MLKGSTPEQCALALATLRAGLDLTEIEKRVLTILGQEGPTHRRHIVAELAPSDTETVPRNFDTAAAMIMGNWCRRLAKAALVRQVRHPDGRYSHHEITEMGRNALLRPS